MTYHTMFMQDDTMRSIPTLNASYVHGLFLRYDMLHLVMMPTWQSTEVWFLWVMNYDDVYVYCMLTYYVVFDLAPNEL